MWEKFTDYFLGFASKSVTTVIGALIIFIAGNILIRLLTRLVGSIMQKSGRLDRSFQQFLLTAVRILGAVLTMLICADMLSIPTTSLITLLGTLGLAISLSLQDLVANIAGGIFLMTSHPFKTGDWIEAEGFSGELVKVGLIHTVLRPVGNHYIYVPNGKLMQSSITNYSSEDKRRISFTVPVSYECSTKEARKVIYDTICKDERVLTDTDPFVRVWDLADSAVNIQVRVWAKASDYWELRSSLIEEIKYALEANGISIPFNQLTVSFANGHKPFVQKEEEKD